MRSAALGLALVLLTAGLAGCASSDETSETDLEEQSEPANNSTAPADASPAESEEDEGPTIETLWFNGSVRGHSIPMIGPFCVETCDNQYEFEVAANASQLQVELAWEAEASMMLDADIPYEKCDASMGEDCPPEHASGDEGHLTVRVTEAADVVEGEWQASAWAEDSLPEDVDFTIAVSITSGELPADRTVLG